MSEVRRYKDSLFLCEGGGVDAGEDGAWHDAVKASDYDALAARLAGAERLLRKAQPRSGSSEVERQAWWDKYVSLFHTANNGTPVHFCIYTDDDDGSYRTGCGRLFNLHEEMELYDFCPFCGDPIRAVEVVRKAESENDE